MSAPLPKKQLATYGVGLARYLTICQIKSFDKTIQTLLGVRVYSLHTCIYFISCYTLIGCFFEASMVMSFLLHHDLLTGHLYRSLS